MLTTNKAEECKPRHAPRRRPNTQGINQFRQPFFVSTTHHSPRDLKTGQGKLSDHCNVARASCDALPVGFMWNIYYWQVFFACRLVATTDLCRRFSLEEISMECRWIRNMHSTETCAPIPAALSRSVCLIRRLVCA